MTDAATESDRPLPRSDARALVAEERRSDIARMAMSLIDLRAALETELRTLTSIQRSLERVRGRDGISAEAELLLGEMERQLQNLQQTSTGISDGLRAAGSHLDAIRAASAWPPAQ